MRGRPWFTDELLFAENKAKKDKGSTVWMSVRSVYLPSYWSMFKMLIATRKWESNKLVWTLDGTVYINGPSTEKEVEA